MKLIRKEPTPVAEEIIGIDLDCGDELRADKFGTVFRHIRGEAGVAVAVLNALPGSKRELARLLIEWADDQEARG